MAFFDTTWYCNFGNGTLTGYYAVTVRPQNTAVAAGVIRRQFTTPTVGNERCFICIVAGTTANTTDATWTLTRGAKTTDGTATWQECTGASAVNGDLTNTPTWTATTAYTLGAIVKRVNAASYWICSTAGTSGGSEPAWANDNAGTTRTDNTATWTCLGAVGNFTGGQAPFARLASACASTWFAAGSTIYIGDNHAETQATAITITPAGTGVPTSVGKILCHNDSGSYPPASSDLTTGATITTTGAVTITFNPGGATYYVYGIAFQAGVGSAGVTGIIFSGGTALTYFDNCIFKIGSTSSSGLTIQVSSSAAANVIWNNCTVFFGHVNHYIDTNTGIFIWQNTGPVLVSGSSVPANFIGAQTAGRYNSITLEGLDLSQLTGNLLSQPSASQMGNWLVKDCKLNGSMSIATPITVGQIVQIFRSDSAAIAYKSARYVYEGTETTETSITRVDGAEDVTGQAQSRKLVTTANAHWLRPFNAEPYAIWNSSIAVNVTVTVYGTINAGSVPNNDDIWIEIEYLGDSASPLGEIVSTTKANYLATNAAVASDSSSWNGGGSGGGWSPFKLTATLSSPQPQLPGYLHVRVRVAKASATYYMDPKIELT